MAPVICALDIATMTGIVIGRPNSVPLVSSINLADAGVGRPRRFYYLFNRLTKIFTDHKVTMMRFELPLEMTGVLRLGADENVLLFLRGAIGVAEAAAFKAGIEDIKGVNIKDARQHLTGYRTFPKGQAKPTTLKFASMICKGVRTFDEADAYAIWSRECALANPRTAHLSSPLFAAR